MVQDSDAYSHFDKMVNHLLDKRENCILLMKILTEVYPMDFGEEYLINDNVIGEKKIAEYVTMTFNKFIDGHEIRWMICVTIRVRYTN